MNYHEAKVLVNLHEWYVERGALEYFSMSDEKLMQAIGLVSEVENNYCYDFIACWLDEIEYRERWIMAEDVDRHVRYGKHYARRHEQMAKRRAVKAGLYDNVAEEFFDDIPF